MSYYNLSTEIIHIFHLLPQSNYGWVRSCLKLEYKLNMIEFFGVDYRGIFLCICCEWDARPLSLVVKCTRPPLWRCSLWRLNAASLTAFAGSGSWRSIVPLLSSADIRFQIFICLDSSNTHPHSIVYRRTYKT